jgi:MFS family permease
MLHTLVTLEGNAKASVWTEPMWGLSMALVMPYLSVFMLALGLRDEQIGLLATIGMVSQMVFGLLSGVITDKLGRRWTTALFDVAAWVIPSLIWMVAQNFWFFLLASLINGTWQVTQNSWDCLLVEDADRKQLTKIYSLVRVAADCSAFFAPIAAVLVHSLGLEHAVRILFANAAVIMMAKIIILFHWSTETRTGRTRMEATRGVPIWRSLAEYRGVFGIILRSRGSLFALAIMALVAAVSLINSTFWSVAVTGHLGVPDALLPLFPMVRSVLSIVLFFTVIPKLTAALDLKRPTLWGFGVFLVGQLLLVAIPAPGAGGSPSALVYAMLAGTLIFDSFGAGMAFMLSESLVALHVDEAERSRIMAIQRMAVMLVAAPFGWIGGWLSGMGRTYPFVLTSVLLVVGIVLAALAWVPTHADGSAHPHVDAGMEGAAS